MNEGRQVIAKILQPRCGVEHYDTASEVATMELLRTNLALPVPKVFAWCSRAQDTAVGAEYIVMEKLVGIPLHSVWKSMAPEKRFSLVENLVDVQGILSSAKYPGYGSIYFEDDLSKAERRPFQLQVTEKSEDVHRTYALGPAAGITWSGIHCGSSTIHRGPWSSAVEYLRAVGQRELLIARRCVKLPISTTTLRGPNLYGPTKEKAIQAIETFLKLLPDIVPSDQAIVQPTAWHCDFGAEYILVDPVDHAKICGIIDWREVEAKPSFMYPQLPRILKHDGPQVESYDYPSPPDGLKQMSHADKCAAVELHLDQALTVAYRSTLKARQHDIWKAYSYAGTHEAFLNLFSPQLSTDGWELFMMYVVVAQNEGLIKHQLADLISDDDILTLWDEVQAANSGMDLMAQIKQTTGYMHPRHAIVGPEFYEDVRSVLQDCKKQTIDKYSRNEQDRIAWENAWPFVS